MQKMAKHKQQKTKNQQFLYCATEIQPFQDKGLFTKKPKKHHPLDKI